MKNDGPNPESFAIIGAAMEVHRALGSGFLETVYHRSLAIELEFRGIPTRREAPLPITYKGQDVGTFRADFICFSTIIVELKAQLSLTQNDNAQVINYLKASSLETALLFNFGSLKLEYRRLINATSPLSSASSP